MNKREENGPSENKKLKSKCKLTNRFHVTVRLFSNRSQMTSKCGKNKKVAHEAIAECVTDVLTTRFENFDIVVIIVVYDY